MLVKVAKVPVVLEDSLSFFLFYLVTLVSTLVTERLHSFGLHFLPKTSLVSLDRGSSQLPLFFFHLRSSRDLFLLGDCPGISEAWIRSRINMYLSSVQEALVFIHVLINQRLVDPDTSQLLYNIIFQNYNKDRGKFST